MRHCETIFVLENFLANGATNFICGGDSKSSMVLIRLWKNI